MNWMRLKILALTILTGPVFGAEKFLLNPAPDEDYLIKINDGGVIKDLMRFDADTNKVIVDGDLEATGVTTGFTAASAAPDWLTATPYGLNEIVVDPNSGITYRANVGHTSTGTNLTDDVSKYDIIGSASNGVIVTDWQSFSPTLSGNFAATEEIYIYRRVGSTAEIRFSFKTGGSLGSGEPILTLPAGMTPSEAGTNDREKVGTYNVYNPLVASSIADGQLEGTFYVGGTHPTTHLTFIYRTLSRNNLGNWDHANNTIPINSGVSGTIIVRIAEWANSGVTVSIQDLTEETKWVTESVVPITLVNHAGSLNTATGLFQGYKDTNGKYGLRGNLFLNTGGSDDANFQVHLDQAGGSIAFESFQQALSCNGNSAGSTPATMTRCLAQGSNDIGIICTNCGSGLNELAITFDITLASKPNWFDSNRENPASVSAFVPEATASVSGIVGTGAQTFAGEKTFTSNQVIHRDSIANGQVVFQHIGTPNSGVWEGLWYGRSLGSQLLQIESFSTGQSATALVQLTANMDTGDTGQGGRHQVYMGSGHTPSSYFGFGSPGVWAAWNTVFDDTDGSAMVISNPTAYRVAFSASKGGGGATDGFVNFRIQGTGLKAITLYLANGTPFELIQ